ncbi:MAG: hypothetical protein ACYDAQ_08025 [Mycobacteriales bacterium]
MTLVPDQRAVEEFEFVTYRHNWGADRAYFLEIQEPLRSLPVTFH